MLMTFRGATEEIKKFYIYNNITTINRLDLFRLIDITLYLIIYYYYICTFGIIFAKSKKNVLMCRRVLLVYNISC